MSLPILGSWTPFAMILMLQSAAHAETAYHISPDGNDLSGDGSPAAPWKTIAAARDAISSSGANANMQDDIVVNLRRGRYEIGETLHFTSADSGSNGHHITYRSFPGETAVVSGGKRVTGWTQVPGKPYWVASVPAYAGFADYFRQLYVNGVRATRARSNWITGVSHFDDPATPQAIDGISFNAADLKDYTRVTDLRLFHIASFKVDEFPVVSIQDDAVNGMKKVRLQQPYCQIRHDRGEGFFEATDQWMIVNAIEELDEPGEWYLDRAARQVFYFPNSFEDMTTAAVYVPQVETLVRFTGSSPADKVRDIRMQDLVFEHGNWFFPRDYFIGGAQAEILYRGVSPTSADPGYSYDMPGQIVLDHTDRIQFIGNTIRYQASCGIQPFNGAVNTLIQGNIFHDLTGAAVIGGRWGGGPAIPHPEICRNTVVSNNVIRNIGVDFMAATLVNNLQHHAFQVIHNDMADAPYMGFHQRHSKSTLAASAGLGGTVVSFNKISLANTAARYGVGDGGYIYTYGIWPDSLVRGNDIHSINGANANVSGFYLDNQSYGIRVESNLMRDVKPGIMGYKFVRSLDDDPAVNSADGNWGDSTLNWFKVVTDPNFHQLAAGQPLPDAARDIVELAGLEPEFAGLTNRMYSSADLARGRPATASSQWNQGTPPAAAVDWDYGTIWHQASGDPRAWWSVDLGSPHVVQRLEIAARTDLDQPDARRNFQVQGSNDGGFASFTVLGEQNEVPFAYRKNGLSNSWIRYLNHPRGFRYLRVIKTKPGTLNFSTFQVHGYPAPPSTADYSEWAGPSGHALAGGPDDDDDGDGLSNREEYAFGLNPADPASVNPFPVQLEKGAGTFTYKRRDPSLGTGLTYTIWKSADLQSWTRDGGAAQVPANPDGGGSQEVVVTVSLALLASPKLFVKVAAE